MLLSTISEEDEIDDDSVPYPYDIVYNNVHLYTHMLKVVANMVMQRG